jgi:hypothetical protein
MPLDSARLRKLADELEAEELEAEREKRDAETTAEKEKAEQRIEALEQQLAELKTQREAEPEPEPDDDETGTEDEARPKMRRGRKRGQVYQDRKGEPGYVYQGEDEPDLVPVEDEDAA